MLTARMGNPTMYPPHRTRFLLLKQTATWVDASLDIKDLTMDNAAAVNQEVLQLFEAGADVVQLNEPWLQAR